MLKLTRKTEYALIALRHLRLVDLDEVVSAKDIAAHYNIPQPLLAKVLQELSRRDFVEPVQGPKGGYRLKAKLDTITMTQFFEMMEGPLGLMDCYFDSNCKLLDNCNIRLPIQRINESMRTMFDKMTLSDVTI
ncbi:MAG: Rrf2 family transcriptional regulator [Candidatus Marinimicrobia bacterium]|nr:Rrf2 family transcriptional regulator [Candidatus Neomarinimicrobiota bacterium]MDP7121455.1 Rrf2 family transcriptional regulator [Candidatus Neomarinimicrobiota bacterium]MDP7484287.1 Rrf2 family transcriptional regulator [Candidatus Neomarinimicrobiota bacterium]MDP7527936.1 Rrf2 family transcriptional regulator [Candidatus Neomarinimicrobiota bacterium]MDP7715181.1 Rrf2 family transcriptional regulator [Candidatus Neomarinimicrobiota bacterium]